MATELSRKVYNIMAREMGHLGKFIVNKQCKDLGINPEELGIEDLFELSKALGKVMVTFAGEEKAKKIEQEVRKLSS